MTVHGTASHIHRSAQLTEQTARFLVGAIRAGELSATAVVAACLQQIAECERAVKAWSWVDTEGTGNPIFSTIWTLVGAPAITLPLLQSAEGMPIGVQLVGRLHGDAGLLAAPAWLERSCGGFAKRFGRADVDA